MWFSECAFLEGHNHSIDNAKLIVGNIIGLNQQQQFTGLRFPKYLCIRKLHAHLRFLNMLLFAVALNFWLIVTYWSLWVRVADYFLWTGMFFTDNFPQRSLRSWFWISRHMVASITHVIISVICWYSFELLSALFDCHNSHIIC